MRDHVKTLKNPQKHAVVKWRLDEMIRSHMGSHCSQVQEVVCRKLELGSVFILGCYFSRLLFGSSWHRSRTLVENPEPLDHAGQ